MKALIDAKKRSHHLGFTVFGVEGGRDYSRCRSSGDAGRPPVHMALRDAIFTHPTMAEGLGTLFTSSSARQLELLKHMPIEGLKTLASHFGPQETMRPGWTGNGARGMTVFARINHAGSSAAEAGMMLRPTEVILFGNHSRRNAVDAGGSNDRN